MVLQYPSSLVALDQGPEFGHLRGVLMNLFWLGRLLLVPLDLFLEIDLVSRLRDVRTVLLVYVGVTAMNVACLQVATLLVATMHDLLHRRSHHHTSHLGCHGTR